MILLVAVDVIAVLSRFVHALRAYVDLLGSLYGSRLHSGTRIHNPGPARRFIVGVGRCLAQLLWAEILPVRPRVSTAESQRRSASIRPGAAIAWLRTMQRRQYRYSMRRTT